MRREEGLQVVETRHVAYRFRFLPLLPLLPLWLNHQYRAGSICDNLTAYRASNDSLEYLQSTSANDNQVSLVNISEAVDTPQLKARGILGS